MTDDYTKEIRDRLKNATPGPWFDVWAECLDCHTGGSIALHAEKSPDSWATEEDRILIRNAPADIARLLEERDVLREALRKSLRPLWEIRKTNDFRSELFILASEQCAILEEALAWKPKGMEEK